MPKRAWQTLSAGAGAKGHRFYDWATVDLTEPRPGSHRLLIHRNRTTRELAYYCCCSPAPMPLATLVHVAGSRWRRGARYRGCYGECGTARTSCGMERFLCEMMAAAIPLCRRLVDPRRSSSTTTAAGTRNGRSENAADNRRWKRLAAVISGDIPSINPSAGNQTGLERNLRQGPTKRANAARWRIGEDTATTVTRQSAQTLHGTCSDHAPMLPTGHGRPAGPDVEETVPQAGSSSRRRGAWHEGAGPEPMARGPVGEQTYARAEHGQRIEVVQVVAQAPVQAVKRAAVPR